MSNMRQGADHDPPADTGRPRVPIDWKVFENLCLIQCTPAEIASTLGIAKSTLQNRAEWHYNDSFSAIYKRFCENGHASLRRNQWKMSSKNAAMAIWLGKQYLGQKDVIYNENELGGKTLDSLDKYLEAKESDDADGAFKP